MKWTDEAEAALKKVPFFVRKKVRTRVEKEAAENGKTGVTLSDVKATQAHYLKKMSREVNGYQVDACFGSSGCPHRTMASEELVEKIERIMADADLLGFLRSRVQGDLKFHHEFRISIADCPNACSQPQIKDVGILGAATPAFTEIPCSSCGACASACKEDAMVLSESGEATAIDDKRCVHCGSCIAVCPTDTLKTGKKGYRVLIGGKLGRHPRLARELPGIHDPETVVRMIGDFLAFYKAHSTRGQRFAQLLTDADIDEFSKKWSV
ncbi:4Fe-4S dicluster domain-containing protein [uncultured Desulfosarcina sp.]|uniref:4Fe-4S dicluster domain-containing protein n=1 Tax=uncultured Desulfosarcina sp. TaxID=218289 RepID=UPI0029C77474|nr:4Fe-4S dicluster domain-containing protein [uncultured Desulfosarcina sp.]